ncbi:hypothetical protein NC797_06930 [Aquibacillus sp. 3ASR75-11]|uniref:Uncharacterized protein n=1 Tax=Terrihalobacillus insolitus TaxID=2950438 RepID=A0A9X4ALH0_9BACI|nr:hypothetical protein [Terrihalobacillus insolitus]MDC3424241.1 hypothetical protein [Terrihalobacillus insolitus]
MVRSKKQLLEEVIKLKEQLLEAISPREVRYYKDRIHRVLDEIDNIRGTEVGAMENRTNGCTEQDLKRFVELKEYMMDADSPQEVRYYEKQIHDLITECEKMKKVDH